MDKQEGIQDTLREPEVHGRPMLYFEIEVEQPNSLDRIPDLLEKAVLNALIEQYDNHPHLEILNLEVSKKLAPLTDSEKYLVQVVISNISERLQNTFNFEEELLNNPGFLQDIVIGDNIAQANLGDAIRPVIVRTAQSPNWGGGGPGGEPISPPLIQNMTNGRNDLYQLNRFNLAAPHSSSSLTPLENIRNNLGGKDVVIGILDTCPTQEVWDTAVSNFSSNQLLQELNSKITLYTESDGGLSQVLSQNEETDIYQDIDPHWSFYPMVDHGIFVASIIHSIAPNADIHLFRVLTDDGLSIFPPVARQLNAFVDHHNDSNVPIIVNCSLAYAHVEEAIRRDIKLYPEQLWQSNAVRNSDSKPDPRITLVTGAAGNEHLYRQRQPLTSPSTPDYPTLETTPYPLYPAAYDSTLGVSALTRILQEDNTRMRASYANWSDDWDLNPDNGTHPPRRGIATMGGEIFNLGNRRITYPYDSVLGLYISEQLSSYPLGTLVQNTSGWARWSGTSFATAITTGILALLASQRYVTDNTSNSQQVLADLLGYCGDRIQIPLVGGGTIDGEHILNVTQGPESP